MDEQKKELKKQKVEQEAALNEYVKNYFQEWLDINALTEFRSKIKLDTTVKQDWLNLAGVSY